MGRMVLSEDAKQRLNRKGWKVCCCDGNVLLLRRRRKYVINWEDYAIHLGKSKPTIRISRCLQPPCTD